jgi:hypothetical protein
MKEDKFIEDETIKDNCKMLFTVTCTDEDYQAKEEYKKNIVLRFMDLLKTDIYANEIEVVHPEFDKQNDRIILLDVTVNNGKWSKSLIREAVKKGSSIAELHL